MLGWIRSARALRRDRTGSAAVEVALVSPILCAMVLSAVDLANGFAMKLALEQAAGRTAELATAPGTVAQSYANLAEEVATAYGKSYQSAVVENWLECGSTRNSSFTAVCPAGQATARYVSIRITAEFVPYFNYAGLLKGSGPNGGFLATGDAAVRVQ